MKLYCFDFFGAYLGYMDGRGNFFDSRGCRWARLGPGNQVYDLNGNLRGRIDAQGNFLTEQDGCRGYLRDWNAELVTGGLGAANP